MATKKKAPKKKAAKKKAAEHPERPARQRERRPSDAAHAAAAERRAWKEAGGHNSSEPEPASVVWRDGVSYRRGEKIPDHKG